ncbi:aldehyde dehydrogenase family protein [Leptothrix discophora]|uniref:Aldehyde dehydrogenase family protein n=1 Tax=Leptothrix discophora TaxID=89 RepID=A0ABT9G8Q9_LEPDI|nr:aldehyde dehydrogenase family protein [Leptothrix discophora]MDP4302878.1 aldehyde dehydrogenase family protein [Leptothrix discophora]
MAPTLPSGLRAALPFDPALVCIAGQWRRPQGLHTLPLIDPSTGVELGRVARAGAPEIDAAVQAARCALRPDEPGSWAQASPHERGLCLQRIAALVRERVDELARLEALDAGLPLSRGRADAMALARRLEGWAATVGLTGSSAHPAMPGQTLLSWREPLGVIGLMLPTQGSLTLLGDCVGAALAAGNACIVKPAETVVLSVLAFAHICHEAGLPAGTLNVVPGLSQEAGAALVEHPGVAQVTVAGSAQTAAAVRALAGRHGKDITVLQVGSLPQLVFEDADLDRAVPELVAAGVHRSGQSLMRPTCILARREIHAELLERMALRYRQLRVGTALADRDLGPMASPHRRDQVESQIAFAAESGLRLVAQGEIDAEAAALGGHWVRPTLLTPWTTAWTRRIAIDPAGPVQVVLAFDDEDEAVELTHACEQLRGVGLWTRDGARQWRLAHGLRCDRISVNGADDPAATSTAAGLAPSHAAWGMDLRERYTRVKSLRISHD